MFSHITYLVLLHYLATEETQKRAYWCTVRATQSNCCSAIDFVYPEPCPQQPRAQCIDYKIQRVIQQHEYESWVKKIEEIKQMVEFRQCTNIAFEEKMQFSCFPVLPGSAETQVIWCGIVVSLIAYFITNISAKICQNPFMCQCYSKSKVGRFLGHEMWNNNALFRWLIRL